jgi:hypothetical protein
VQTAGGGDRLTAEIRAIRDGPPRQWVIGRSGEDASGTEVIEWNDGKSIRGVPNEVLAADEVADVWVDYFRTRFVPDGYSHREIQS